MLHKGKPRIFDASKSASNSSTSSTFTTNSGGNPHSARKNKLHSKSTYFYRWGSRLNYIVPSVCALALLVGGIITISPILNKVEQASAADDNPAGYSTSNPDGVPCIKLSITPNTADSTNGNVKVGEVAYFSNNIEVGGNHISKYSVTLHTPSGKTGELVGRANPYATVGKVDANTAPADFKDNTWGYAVSELNNANVANDNMAYSPIPSGTDGNGNSVEVAKREKLSAISAIADNYKLTFAAKLGDNLPSDHYEVEVYLSIVANPITLTDITTMQEMDSSICSASSENDTKQLIDERDGKSYWVAKLKDGNCWMTQNLDLDLSTNKTLTPEDSDLKSNWTPNNSTLTGNIDTGWTDVETDIQSWNPGDYYYVADTSWADCGVVTNLETCSQWTTTPATEGAHYHVGNYYSWNTATAGTGGTITSGEANSSICPTRWKLPTSANSNKNSFQYLMEQYGITSSNVNNEIRQAPLYFIPAGSVGADRLYFVGSQGHYWSSTPSPNSESALNFLFTSDDLAPFFSYYRFLGYSVRCLAK